MLMGKVGICQQAAEQKV